MRLIKMFGVAALAAMSLMALVGASSAMADNEVVLCKTEKVLCGSTEIWPVGTEFKSLTLGEPVLKGTGFISEEKCKVGHFNGKVTDADGMGAPLQVATTSASFLECTPCKKVTITTLPKGTISVAPVDIYSLNITSEALATFEECPLGLSCAFKTSTGTLSISNEGGGAILALANGVELVRHSGSEFLCGNVGKWFAHYVDGLTSTGGKVYLSLFELP